MPSRPKVKKEDMLQCALEIVMEDGYSALNIKAVAQKLNCSTAPISWQFKGMEGLRTELIPYAEDYVRNKYGISSSNAVAAFEQEGRNTVSLAMDAPNLFRFLYMGERSQLLSEGFALPVNQESHEFYEGLAGILKVTPAKAAGFVSTMVIYTQGIGTLIASGLVHDTKENIFRMLHETGVIYLRGLGVEERRITDILTGGEK